MLNKLPLEIKSNNNNNVSKRSHGMNVGECACMCARACMCVIGGNKQATFISLLDKSSVYTNTKTSTWAGYKS